MKKRIAGILFAALTISIYVQAQTQKINVVSVSQEQDTYNFFTMMKEAFPLAFKDPAAPRFIFFNDNKNFLFGIGGSIQMNIAYDFNGLSDYNSFMTSEIAPNGEQAGVGYGN